MITPLNIPSVLLCGKQGYVVNKEIESSSLRLDGGLKTAGICLPKALLLEHSLLLIKTLLVP
jgi:hypothetical protein